MRGLRRLTFLVGLAFLIMVFQPYTRALWAGHQTTYFTQSGFQPVGIAFNFRIGPPANEPRMLVTRPLTGNPRQLVQRDGDAESPAFEVRATLDPRPSTGAFVDSVAAIPDALGLAATEGGFTPNNILVSQGLSVYQIAGAGSPPITPSLLKTISGSTCAATGDSDLIFDRWGIQFGGKAILTCQGHTGREIWTITSSGTAVRLTTLPGTYSGRADITFPNFPGCAGCLALVRDDTLNVTLVNGSGGTSTITVGPAASGRRQVLTVPTRVYAFDPAGGCLFGTIPGGNQIRMFPCSTFPNVFDTVGNGDLLIFTPAGTVVRVPWTGGAATTVDTGAGTYEDLAFPNLRLVQMSVRQPAAPNPNQGVQGQIVFHIISSNPTFNPQTDVNISTIRFGRTGSEDSVQGNCVNVGTDLNGDTWGELKCNAVQAIAMCDEVTVQCIVTGETYNQTRFEGD